jgi:ATP-binding cassette subfamily F protein 3
MRAFIDRFRYQATKAAQVQSRIKMLDRIVPIDVPPERKRVRFTFPPCPKSGRLVLELADAHKAYGDNVVLNGVSLHVERGDRIALVAPNGAGKSTLMRLLAGTEAPDRGVRRVGHQVVMQYFAQDEANRLNPALTVYETMEADSPVAMVPIIRNILGGFLFSGEDIYKKAAVLSGGERTRLAVARMLLRPSNTLLLDEPTNHLDLDSKDVLLDALADFGGTLIFVSHDRYFVDKLATKIVEVGHGAIEMYPGTYEQFLWSRDARARGARESAAASPRAAGPDPAASAARPLTSAVSTSSRPPAKRPPAPAADKEQRYEERKKAEAALRRQRRDAHERARRVADLEGRIAEREQAIRELEAAMAEPGFYDDRTAAEASVARHRDLMWEVGDLMEQWEALQSVEPAERS